MRNRKEELKIAYSNNIIKAKLNGIGFLDDGFFVIYIPSLGLSGYGDNEEEAKEMIKVVFDELSQSLLSLSKAQMLSELKEMGWQQEKYRKKRLTHLSDTTFQDIKKELDISDDIEIRNMPIAV